MGPQIFQFPDKEHFVGAIPGMYGIIAIVPLLYN